MKHFIILFLLFSTCFIQAQTPLEMLDEANNIYRSDPEASFEICNEVEAIINNKIDSNALGEVYLCQGRYQLLKANLEQSTKLLNKALLIFEQLNNLSRQAKCHSVKSILLGRIANNKEALYHERKALELYIQDENVQGQVNSLTNLSLNFVSDEQNDSSLYYLSKLKRYTSQMDESSKYFMHQNFGTYFYNVRNYQESLKSYQTAYDIANTLDMVDSKSTVLMLMATPYIALKQYKLAESSLNKSLAIASGADLLHESNEAYTMLINLNEELGDYKNAFQLKKLNEEIEKKIYNLDKINRINDIESQLELSEKEKIIAEKELELKNEQLNNIKAESRITQLIFVVAFSLLIIIFIVIILFRVKKLNTRIQSQKLMLEQKNTEITDSITYAKRIQAAILPPMASFKEKFPNAFILYKPKDIVAGDFYWMKTVGDIVLFAAADCTGHGVPGAMVSVVCSNALNESVKELQTGEPAQILEMTRTLIKESLSSEIDNVNDGMDIALCAINYKKMVISFSGANNPLYILRDEKLIELKGDKQPVGNHYKEKVFTEHKFNLEKGDTLYTFTDGYADQFGGPKGKKFMYKKFKDLLIKISTQPIEYQQEVLNQTFEDWKGDLEQIDDVCVIGVKV
jgi:serine phosphatase RsbU (regulator of sigma subunit)